MNAVFKVNLQLAVQKVVFSSPESAGNVGCMIPESEATSVDCSYHSWMRIPVSISV